MAEPRKVVQKELLAEIHRSWARLLSTLGNLTEAQLTRLQDANGWTIKDHVVHVALWEESLVSLFQGRPGHEALGVDRDLYTSRDYDAINEAIYRQQKDLPLPEVLVRFQRAHEALIALVETLTDEDLDRPFHAYVTLGPGRGEPPSVVEILRDYTVLHYAEHRAWIEAIASGDA